MPTRLGHHDLIERLGQGAMGIVWKARDTRSDRLVALKVLAEAAGGRRFRREFRAAQRLDHPNVVRVLEMGTGSLDGVERHWFTMELVVGTTLRALIDRDAAGWPPARNSPEWLASRLSVMHQAALGLAHCHEHGVLHRDLKPTNVLVGEDGVVKLADFGLARMDAHPSSLSGAGQLIGTVAYMSPEQARGGQLDARSDVHGLGALLHEVATGQPAFQADDLPALLMQVLFQAPPDPLAVNPGLDRAIAELAMSCLAKDPLARPQSAEAVARRLREIADSAGLALDHGPMSSATSRLRTHAPQLVGRERERAALREALEQARTRPVVVTVAGRSGIGKSRLLEDLRVDAELAGFHVLASSASASPRPLGALRDALAAALRSAPVDARHDVRLLTTVLPELVRADVGAEETEGEVPRTEAPPADRMRVAWAAEALLAHWLDQRPRVLVLDDLQWSEPLSAQVIERLAERDAGRTLLVAIFQEDPAEARPAAERLRQALADRPGAVEVVLEALDEGGVARVIESMVGCAPSVEVAAEVWRATGGVPHDVEQVMRELGARGALRVDGERLLLTLPASARLSELSASEATRSHLATLGPTARRVVLAVMLAGRGLPVGTLASALALDEDAVLDELEMLVGEGILRDGPGPDVVSLAHDRIRQAISSGSSVDEMGSLRSSLARALERDGSTAGGPHRIAELDLAAGSLEDALRTVPPSAEAFAAVGLHASAIERYEALIALARQSGVAPPALVRKRRAEFLGQSGRSEDALAAFAELADDPSVHDVMPPWLSLRMQAFFLMLLTRHDEAVQVLERAMEIAQAAGDASGVVRALSVLGTVEDRRRQHERARRLHEEAATIARERGNATDLAMALTNLAVSAYARGRLADATPAYEEAAALFERLGDPLHASNCRAGLAAVLLARGEPEACRPIAREALAEMRRLVDVRGLSRVLELLGLASLELGEVDDAESHLGEALAIRGRLSEPWAEGETTLNLASLAVHRCQWSRAERLLADAGEIFSRASDAGRGALVMARRADLAWRSAAADSRARAEAALAAANEASAITAGFEARLTLARIDANEGNAQRACARLREALDDARSLQSAELSLGLALALECELLTSRALAGDVEALAQGAERIAARAAQRAAPARAMDLLAAAAAFRATGSDEGAGRSATCLAEAERVIERLRAPMPDDEGEAFVAQHAHARLFAMVRERDQEDVMSSIEREELIQLRIFHSLVMDSDPSEPDTLLAAFITVALTQLDFARGLVFVAAGDDEDSADAEFSCRVAREASGAEIQPAERLVPDQLLRLALERGEPVLTVGVREDPSVDWEGSVAEMSVEAFAAVPVVTRDGLKVVAYFDGPPPRRDVREALRRLAPVFGDLGSLLDRARRVKLRTDRAEAILSSIGASEGPIVGLAANVESLRRLIRTVAPTDASVLVLGESGTGKELVARELHGRSLRKDGPLLSRSCAELTETLLESELFGHEKGAFTGAARDRAGLFEAASGGTLFLDEVGEMSPGLQAKLLRVLETGEVTRLGSTKSRKVDVRVVAATHRDLAAGVKDGSFRQDLYYRLKVIELRIPALRERRADVPLLAHHFLALSSAGRARAPRSFTHDALRALTQHEWPGNVRELRNVIERAVILSGDRDEIGLDLLPTEVVAGGESGVAPGSGPAVAGTDLPAAREAFEKACIERALDECSGNRTHAARALGISVRSLQQKLGRHGVS